MRFLLGFLALLGAAQAAVVQKLDLAGLVFGADAIVVGRVLDRESRFEGTRIVTRVRIEADTVLKGETPAVVTVEVLGGEVDGIAQRVDGMAAFEPDEQVAVFLEKQGDRFRTVGLAQGKLRIEADLRGVNAVRALDGLVLVERDATGQLVPATPTLPAVQSFAGFLSDLAGALKTPTP